MLGSRQHQGKPFLSVSQLNSTQLGKSSRMLPLLLHDVFAIVSFGLGLCLDFPVLVTLFVDKIFAYSAPKK